MSALSLLHARRRRASLAQSALLEQFAYHGTPKANLKSIRAVGLLPSHGDNTKDAEGHDVDAKVCLATDVKTAKKYAGSDGVVLKVDLDHPELAGATAEPDEHEKNSLTLVHRVPPAAITVKRTQERALNCFKLSDGYARDLQSRREFTGINETTSQELATHHGFREAHRVDTQYGTVIRYFHPRGHNLVVTDLPENLKGHGAPWETKWEYHSVDGVKSVGTSIRDLQSHLRNQHL